MEMLDRIFYKFFASIDDLWSWIERYSGKLNTWVWHKRVNLLRKRRKLNATRRARNNK